MKTLQKTLLAVATTAILATTANAGINTAGQPYAGVKVGQFDTSYSVNEKNQTAYGVFGGYQFDPNWGVEAEFVGGDKAKATVDNVEDKIKTKTYGVYGTYNYNFANLPVYAKAKLGLAKTEAKLTTSNWKDSSTNFAYGAGVGYQATPALSVEAEYAKAEKNTNLWTIGAKVKF